MTIYHRPSKPSIMVDYIAGLEFSEALDPVVDYFKKSRQAGVEKARLYCILKFNNEPVIIDLVFRHTFQGNLYKEELRRDGWVKNIEVDGKPKKLFNLKIKGLNFGFAAGFIVKLIPKLLDEKLIAHSRAWVKRINLPMSENPPAGSHLSISYNEKKEPIYSWNNLS